MLHRRLPCMFRMSHVETVHETGSFTARMPIFALVLVGASVLLTASQARAYCMTMTCDPVTEDCGQPDENSCYTVGKPIAWPTNCTGYSLQKNASKLVPFDLFEQITELSFRAWTEADCGDGRHPNIEVTNFGPIECNVAEFNRRAGNANIVMFRDDDWPYQSSLHTLALTTVTYGVETGTIYDADIEINSAKSPISTSDEHITNDLQSILTHEVGHYFGLAHSADRAATMFAGYLSGSVALRTLADDDVAGICAAYPPDVDKGECQPKPYHGLKDSCGDEPETRSGCSCSTGASSRGMTRNWLGFMAFSIVLGAVRQRARHRSR